MCTTIYSYVKMHTIHPQGPFTVRAAAGPGLSKFLSAAHVSAAASSTPHQPGQLMEVGFSWMVKPANIGYNANIG